ncbi:short chain dehydrogenase domain-containing protein [Hirsutella rhossiliensis]|uniref:Short chain dehydrogenase domain-containing protein n=1 Tax=Hirsutella rhossiliensis TaxID=111463 RepID=A0A9P8MYY0_9HYPO|nr:short chain dehydrogenase domain-containing protein [Hirsutella rhossiliensis]KAH0963789.1 short chain dehydrogenase domain-containing protein [Hirsutella rhossiliensis]
MQSYHMACILLLVNEPQEAIAIRSTVSARLQSYRRGEREALRHARELCGISLAKSSDANRVHSVQPLFVAGQVFEDSQDVKVVLDLLEEIERDLGWATSHYVSKLGESVAGKNVEYLFFLVNNAGISVEAGHEPLRAHETPEDWFDLTMAVNVKSCFLASKYVLAQILKQDKSSSGDRGWIINMSSIYA